MKTYTHGIYWARLASVRVFLHHAHACDTKEHANLERKSKSCGLGLRRKIQKLIKFAMIPQTTTCSRNALLAQLPSTRSCKTGHFDMKALMRRGKNIATRRTTLSIPGAGTQRMPCGQSESS
jgi:hypothetical protein